MSDSQTEDIERLRAELAAANKELASYHDMAKALTWNSIATFTWDYTTGIIDQDVQVQTPNGTLSLAEMSGVTLPATIEEVITAFADKYVHPDWAAWYKTNFSTKFVTANFEEIGPYNLAFERKLVSDEVGALYARFEAPITKDPDTGHLMARFVMTDCTNRYRLVAPIEVKDIDTARVSLLEALRRVFLFVAYADLSTGIPSVLSASDLISNAMMEKKSASLEDMRTLLATQVVEDDRAAFMELTDPGTLSARLEQKGVLTCELSTMGGKRVLVSVIPVDLSYATKNAAAARYYDDRYTDYIDDDDNNNNNNNNKGLFNDVVITVADVTKDRNREQLLMQAQQNAQAANEAKTNFLFNMSHDIRTPMNAIIGYACLMEKHLDNPEKLEDYLGKMRASGDMLLELINNVLEMARIESGAMVLDEAVWDAFEMNDSLFAILDEQMKAKGIRFTRSIDVEHRFVYCDSLKLREIFLNILSNAYKYTLEGGSVSMDLVEIPSDREGYALYQTTIADTGIGMSEDYLPHIFDEFSRERTATESRVQGTGLGLSIVKRLVELMDGSIEVTSKLGEGTTFVVSLYHRISSEEALAAPESENIEATDFVGKRILLAEDNDLNAEIAAEILEEIGLHVERAEDGIVAVDMLAKAPAGHYDLVLMDIQMPNLDGYGAVRRIRALDDAAKAGIPIVAMTANAFEEDKQNAIAAGMNDHMAKPIDIDDLMRTLDKHLG